jgi:hypothetical protein
VTTVQLSQPGGIAVVRGREVAIDDRDYHYFQVGRVYAFLLRRDPLFGGYTPAFGPSGAYPVRAETVYLTTGARQVTAFKDRVSLPLDELRAILLSADNSRRR